MRRWPLDMGALTAAILTSAEWRGNYRETIFGRSHRPIRKEGQFLMTITSTVITDNKEEKVNTRVQCFCFIVHGWHDDHW
jgi:hypothetical protein